MFWLRACEPPQRAPTKANKLGLHVLPDTAACRVDSVDSDESDLSNLLMISISET